MPRVALLLHALACCAAVALVPPPRRAMVRTRRQAAAEAEAAAGVRGLTKTDFKIAGSAACGSFIQGYTTGVLGGALLFLAPHFGLAPRQVGAVRGPGGN